MKGFIIFESLVIPTIITFMMIAVFIIDKNNLFFKKWNTALKKNKKVESPKQPKGWAGSQFPDDKNNHLDFSGGTWGI